MLFADSHTPRRAVPSRPSSGFTLIELLVVVAVILVLAGITLGVSRGVQNAQASAKAKAELATLAQAIDQFKLRYGDFPWHQSNGSWDGGEDNTNQMLVYALTGRLILEREDPNNPESPIKAIRVGDDLDDSDVAAKPKFIDITKFEIDDDDILYDPWGNPYKYWYKWDDAPDDWEVFGYHLYSLGADGEENKSLIEESPRTGVIDRNYRDDEKNLDNIFVGE